MKNESKKQNQKIFEMLFEHNSELSCCFKHTSTTARNILDLFQNL